ncbi:MAG: hypothetical protein IM575_10480, partial [Cytophagales bacterium]|nr:hypothetical protein [Cytophagales bacterium]
QKPGKDNLTWGTFVSDGVKASATAAAPKPTEKPREVTADSKKPESKAKSKK